MGVLFLFQVIVSGLLCQSAGSLAMGVRACRRLHSFWDSQNCATNSSLQKLGVVLARGFGLEIF